MNRMSNLFRAILCLGLLLVAALPAFLATRSLATTVGATAAVPSIPVGTVIPVSLEYALSATQGVKGELIHGRVPQDVPLANKQKIPAGSKVFGKVLEAIPAKDDGGPSSVTFRIDSVEIRGYRIHIVTGLRAMAPFATVQHAQTPSEDSQGNPYSWATTVQIGGDIRYGAGGKVTDRRHRVIGKGTADGVLVTLQDAPGSPCAGWPSGQEHPQALWVFSGDACGLYDMKNIRVSQAGNKDPLGQITLTRDEGNLNIGQSPGLLLRVVQ